MGSRENKFTSLEIFLIMIDFRQLRRGEEVEGWLLGPLMALMA